MLDATTQLDSPWSRAKGDMSGDGVVDSFDNSPYTTAISAHCSKTLTSGKLRSGRSLNYGDGHDNATRSAA